MLRVADEYWMDHIDAMDDLRRGIGLRGYGNVKPVDAYKQEGFEMFEQMVAGIRSEVVRRIYTIRVRKEEKVERKSVAKNAVTNAGGDDSVKKAPVKKIKKPGRNDPCPCGKLRPNGLPMKYKDCCGRNG
jgi:preprotein translocase subunit SecA